MEARHEEERRDFAYRIYLTDSLKAIGGLNVRFADIIKPRRPASNESAEEIISRLSAGLAALGEDN